MQDAKQSQTNTLYQSEDDMAWMVRHCSPLLYIHTAAYAHWSGHQPHTASQCNRCASVDLSSFRIKIHHR